jgi:hypothetical protein
VTSLKRDLNAFQSTGGINTGNSFSNKIQDGLDDLISGVTGIRRSKIEALKRQAGTFRTQGDFGSQTRRRVVAPAVGQKPATLSPALHNILQFPEKVATEDGTMLNFPNYIHFRSLERKAKTDKDLRHDIFLYVPDTLNDNLAVTYTEADLKIIDSLIANFVKTDQVQEGWGADKQEIATIMKSMAPGGKMMMSALGRGVNPLKYQLFEGVSFRTFSYTFTLRPKNNKEARKIQEILSVFKREALPGVEGANSRIYTFPTEWSIQFVGPIKDWVDFPLVSVLTGVNVDYAGGQPLALMYDGAPSVVTLTLNFTETTQLTRQKFDTWVSSFWASDRDLSSVEGGTNINTRNVMAQAWQKREAAAIKAKAAAAATEAAEAAAEENQLNKDKPGVEGDGRKRPNPQSTRQGSGSGYQEGDFVGINTTPFAGRDYKTGKLIGTNDDGQGSMDWLKEVHVTAKKRMTLAELGLDKDSDTTWASWKLETAGSDTLKTDIDAISKVASSSNVFGIPDTTVLSDQDVVSSSLGFPITEGSNTENANIDAISKVASTTTYDRLNADPSELDSLRALMPPMPVGADTVQSDLAAVAVVASPNNTTTLLNQTFPQYTGGDTDPTASIAVVASPSPAISYLEAGGYLGTLQSERQYNERQARLAAGGSNVADEGWP